MTQMQRIRLYLLPLVASFCLASCDETAENTQAPVPSAPVAQTPPASGNPNRGGELGDAPRSTLGKALGSAHSVVDKAEQQSQDLSEEFDEMAGGSDTEDD
jgi:hypothetical protein